MRLFLLAAIAVSLFGQGRDWVRANYTKFEYEIPMRDGKKLFTSVYVPKDSGQYPIMLNRTPYSVAPYGVDHYRESLGPSEHFSKDKFIFAYQDVRGRFMSEGEFVEVRPHVPAKKGPQEIDESTDTYDTIDWLVKNVLGNNGKVGQWGISYPGFYTAAGMIDAHPALQASSPQAPVTDYYLGDDSYHNGAFMLAANFGFYANFVERKGAPEPPQDRTRFNYKTPDGYEFFLRMGPLYMADEKYLKGTSAFWSRQIEHPNYDEYWKSRSIWKHFRDIKPNVLTVGGWFDAEDLAGPLRVYETVEKSNPAGYNGIVMGPWTHGSWARTPGDRVGNLHFASKTAEYYREKIEFPFFAHFLKGKGDGKFADAYMFETGTNRWREFAKWPPAGDRRTMYLSENGALRTAPPQAAEAFDEYLSDPNKPVPYVGYTASGMTRDYMTEDQRFAAARPDVLVYETEPLAEDLTVAGPIQVSLHVSTTGTDSDFVVKVIDVYPGDYPDLMPAPEKPNPNPPANEVKMGGYQQLVRGEPFRGKFRKSFEKPEPFTPGRPDKIEFALPDVMHTFRKGHRLMIQIQSSWFPLTDRNPQKFVANIAFAKPEEFVKATQRVYRSKAMPSAITFTVIR
jgi:uncharacterized protein